LDGDPALAAPSASGMLQIRLLGEFDVRDAAQRVRGLESGRLQSLLGYLLLHRDAPQARQRVAFLLWPDSSEGQARTNLRQLLHHLRARIPDADRYLELTPGSVQWRPDSSFTLDVAEFERAADRNAWADALAAYGGDLLPGCDDEWVLAERERLRQRYLTVLERLSADAEALGDEHGAIRYAESLLREDPLREGTYRQLMRIFARRGERGRALQTYHSCASVLERELDVAPAHETQQAYAALVTAPAGAEPAGTRALPLVGRAVEWRRCLDAWTAASGGSAAMLVVSGEPGIGKTRLVEELERWCTRAGAATAWARTYAVEGRLAYAPIVDWLRSKAVRQALEKLDGVWLAEVSRLLPELLVEMRGLRRPDPMPGPQLRHRLFEALERALLARDGPLLLVLDDLQWCDQDSLDFLLHLLNARARAPILIAATLRSDEITAQHPVSNLLIRLRETDRLTEVPLGPLDRADVGALAAQLLQEQAGDAVLDRLWRETEGNPLFLVETIRAGLGNRDVLPAKVQAVIQARLTQLSPNTSALMACAATIGREFTIEVLGEAVGCSEDDLVNGLDEMWSRQIIRQHDSSAYDFTHDKIREVAYAGIGPARRGRLHLAVARALEAANPTGAGPVSGQIAAHYEAAGQAEKAVPFYRQAGEMAQRVFATDDALRLHHRALSLLERVAPGPGRDEKELAARVALGVSLVARKGYAAAAKNYDRAYRLCERLGHPPTPPVLRGLALASLAICDFDRPLALAGQILELAEQDSVLTTEGHYLLGVTRFWRGELQAAREHLCRAIAGYRSEHHRTHLQLFAQDPKVICLSRLALTLWYLGLASQADHAAEEALQLAEKQGHPFTRAYALVYRTWLCCEQGRTARMTQLARSTAELTAQRGLEWQQPWAEAWLGWAQAVKGQPTAGAQRIRVTLDRWAATNENVGRTYGLFLLAKAQQLADERQAALLTVQNALDLTEETGQRYLEADLRRLRGELQYSLGATAEADAELRRSLTLARRQGSRILELRTAVSVARHGGSTEPLATAERAFDRDTDLAEVLEARTLLERLRDDAPPDGLPEGAGNDQQREDRPTSNPHPR
jgi:DNA-binding SARP family transcriptional activator/predicted ATPase